MWWGNLQLLPLQKRAAHDAIPSHHEEQCPQTLSPNTSSLLSVIFCLLLSHRNENCHYHTYLFIHTQRCLNIDVMWLSGDLKRNKSSRESVAASSCSYQMSACLQGLWHQKFDLLLRSRENCPDILLEVRILCMGWGPSHTSGLIHWLPSPGPLSKDTHHWALHGADAQERWGAQGSRTWSDGLRACITNAWNFYEL